MVDIVFDLEEKNSEVISLHEVITTLQKNSPNATLKQIAEWLIIHLVNDPNSPSMGALVVGGGIEPIHPAWPGMDEKYYSLYDLLITLYREGNNWPGDIPF
ncbi:hypothetical protein [Pluralibacter gergoviae]|uniref:hypothetical protein n=1 Tax=Pluralibacter gergoviae TaxID=61647 RepID=UPI0009081B80|nr:hypothetical protein [Pluralibacter gergoviae]MBK4118792.1 hypothetical protein [Pluralibacter gergoviae]HDY9258280.1 hypothetical protein [Klebsiella pneumoniae]